MASVGARGNASQGNKDRGVEPLGGTCGKEGGPLAVNGGDTREGSRTRLAGKGLGPRRPHTRRAAKRAAQVSIGARSGPIGPKVSTTLWQLGRCSHKPRNECPAGV